MFTARYIKEKLDRQPFKPFRISMSNGNTFDVPHHDAAWVTRNAVEVGMDLDADGIAENVAYCAIPHIAEIEDLQPA